MTEQFFTSDVLEALGDGIVLIRGGNVVFSNSAVTELMGGPISGPLDRLAPTVFSRIAADALRDGSAEEVFDRGTPRKEIEAVASRLDHEDGGVIVLLRDVTQRRRIEAMRRDFVADASHELKTPVASIQAAAETLIAALDRDPDAAKRFAHQIHSTAVRVDQIVNDLLDLSRLETATPELSLVQLDKLANKEVQRLADRAKVFDVELKIEAQSLEMAANRKDLRLAIRNLLDNAIEFADGGAVTVRVTREESQAIIEVEDTGIGIPTRDLPRVFERFYRVDAARARRTGGTGLGLAIVKHVVEEHGGSIEVESELGLGSTFRIRLPFIGAVPAEERRPRVLFVCVHNAGRSQMAAALMSHQSQGRIEVLSAGSEPAEAINPIAVEAMAEMGIDISQGRPKLLRDAEVAESDVVITMGCGDACPVYPGVSYEDWELDDPSGQDLATVRVIRDEIKTRVAALVERLLNGQEPATG